MGDRYAAHVDHVEERRTYRRRVRQYLQPQSRTERSLCRVNSVLFVVAGLANLYNWEWAAILGAGLLLGLAAMLMGRRRWKAAEAADSRHPS